MIRYAYTTFSGPPAPFVHVTVGDPNTGTVSVEVPAQIDSAADRTVIPGALIDALGLTQSGSLLVAGLGSVIQSCPTYIADVGIRSLPAVTVKVLRADGEPHVLLGRDVLNQFRILLDGPALALEMG
jgi:hypothetical protein